MKIKFNTHIPVQLKKYFNQEIALHKIAAKENQLEIAWTHLERAHILGQAYPYEHSYAHWKMLLFGIRIKSTKEILGQIPRLLVGGVKSFVGTIPKGNTGGANVSPIKAMPIPEDLNNMLKES